MANNTITRIQELVCNRLNVTLKQLHGPRRDRPVSRPRHIAMYLAWIYTGKSQGFIAKMFQRDRTSVVHAIQSIEYLMEKDQETQKIVQALKAEIDNIGGEAVDPHEQVIGASVVMVNEAIEVIKTALIAQCRKDPLAVVTSLGQIAKGCQLTEEDSHDH